MSNCDNPRRVQRTALLAMRWSGLALAIGLASFGMWVETAVALLVALAQVVGWRWRLPVPWEMATSGVCVVAAISSFLNLYEQIPWWDVPVHFALTGLLAVLVARVVRPKMLSLADVVVTGALLAVIWEVMEFAASRWVDSTVYVAPTDTALDIATGLGGSIATALLWRRRNAPPATHSTT